MNSKALVLAAATTGVAVVTLVALNLVVPISHAEEAPAEGITAEQVFSASIAEPGASSTPATSAFESQGQMEVAALQDEGSVTAEETASSTPPPEAAPVTGESPQAPAIAGGSCAMGAGAGTPVVVPAAGAPPASTAPAPAMEVAQADTTASEAAPPPAPAPEPEAAAPAPATSDAGAMPPEGSTPPAGGDVADAAGSCPTGLTDPNAKPIVVVAQGVPGGPAAPPPGEEGMAPPAPAEVAAVDEGAPEPAAAEPPPPPAPEPAPAAPEPTPEPAAAPPPPKPKPKPKAESKPAAPKKAPPEAKVAWWPAKEAGKLNVVYAGEASFTKAIVVMLDGQFDNADSANQNIKVAPKKGGEVKGKWLVANGNKSMLLLDVAPGLYSVEIGTGLTDKGGRSVGTASSGVVFVH